MENKVIILGAGIGAMTMGFENAVVALLQLMKRIEGQLNFIRKI